MLRAEGNGLAPADREIVQANMLWKGWEMRRMRIITTQQRSRAGGNPVIGRNAANERKAAIEDTLNGSDIVFVTDRSSAGRSPFAVNWMTVIAGLAKSTGILTVRIDMTPFLSREGRGQLKPRKE
ncbi:hypothetical protein MLD38_035495 [Melastoma candidum]|uniref:Uncharacterized protein n=1 Tax=Melastoma candidum TaxID=119954 RepID=A0ACB9LGZ0_9MYRT|nr:hypothetical protein MLD38_035495 [Melastoma candidum]